MGRHVSCLLPIKVQKTGQEQSYLFRSQKNQFCLLLLHFWSSDIFLWSVPFIGVWNTQQWARWIWDRKHLLAWTVASWGHRRIVRLAELCVCLLLCIYSRVCLPKQSWTHIKAGRGLIDCGPWLAGGNGDCAYINNWQFIVVFDFKNNKKLLKNVCDGHNSLSIQNHLTIGPMTLARVNASLDYAFALAH